MKNGHKKRCNRSFALFALFLLCLLCACSREDSGKQTLLNASQMNDPAYSIGVPQGAAAMTVVEKNFPKSKIEYFNSLHDGYLAVKHGKLDAFAFDRHTLQHVILKNPDLALMDEKIADELIVVGSAPGRKDLMEKVNAFIRKYRADGTYQDMYNRWILGTNPQMPVLPEPKHPTITLKIGTDGLNEPMNYYANGELTGFDIEFSRRLGLFLNAKVTFQTMEFSALIIAAGAEKIDLLVANLNGTPERRKKMLLSDTYVDSEISVLVRKKRLPRKAGDLPITDISQLAGRKVGIITGSVYDGMLKEHVPSALAEHFNNFTDQTAALKSGKIAAFLADEPIARDIVNNTSGITHLKKMMSVNGYAFAFGKSRKELH
ncbi:MAG: transporter substrate-binding domain-containing protein, partial [Syntrophales bacterium]|nr:transporter substrate-binding domain-containing protein [Syntrophales bacterium]